MSRTGARVATAADEDLVTEVLALGFSGDPVWGLWAFPDPSDRLERLRAYWRPYVRAALKYDGAWVTGDAGAVSVWVPPGVAEMDEDDERDLHRMVEQVCGERGPALLETYERFEDAHPHDEPHWYLSLLATHPDHRGRGLGMALVADRLDEVDAEHVPAYLESTNDANLARYAAAGFARHGAFDVVGGPTVTTMWRPAR